MSVPEWEFPVDYNIDEVITQAANEWAEKEKIKNQTTGESRAQQELAFRDYLVSERSKNIGKKEKFFWITINPKTGVDLPQLIKATQKMVSKKWIDAYAYVYENTTNNHIHTHALLKATYEVARARKEIANTVSSITDVDNVHCFKFVVLDEEQAKQKLSYMQGKKQPKKLENVEVTKSWREKEMLKDIYISEVLLSC